MGNPVVHFEVNGPDPEQNATFYSELFGWHTQAIPEAGYIMVDTQAGEGINGGFGSPPGAPAHVTFYVEADDLQAVLDRAGELGGRTVMPVMETMQVTLAHLADPQGNVIGLARPPADPSSGAVSPGHSAPVAWFEITGPDPRALWSFYRELFGWEVQDRSPGENAVYGEVRTGTDRGISGGIGGSMDGQAHVNVYARVDDLQAVLDRAEELGGATAMPVMRPNDTTSIAQLRDPQGTTFGLLSGM